MFNPIRFVLGLNSRSNKEIAQQVDEEYKEYKQEQFHTLQEQANKQKVRQEDANGTNDFANVIFSIDTKGQIKIALNWSKPEPHVAESIGKLLYHINNGNLRQNCFAILDNATKQKPKVGQFLRNIMETWQQMADENDPIMEPSEVFKVPIAGATTDMEDDE